MPSTQAVTTAQTQQLYMDGNGRLSCAALRCAGMTAHYSGMKRDLHGARIEKLTPRGAKDFKMLTGVWPKCESCGAEATALA